MDYIARADVEKYLGITLTGNGQNLFNLLSPLMQEIVDDYCNRTWNFENPATDYFDISNSSTYFVTKPSISKTPYDDDYPKAGGIRSVKIDGVSCDMNYVFSYGTYVKLSTFPTLPNPQSFQSVEIVYNSDAAETLPNPVKLALIQWMARKIQTAPDTDRDPVETQAGTVRVRYAQDKLGAMPDFVKMVLDSYRMRPVDRF